VSACQCVHLYICVRRQLHSAERKGNIISNMRRISGIKQMNMCVRNYIRVLIIVHGNACMRRQDVA